MRRRIPSLASRRAIESLALRGYRLARRVVRRTKSRLLLSLAGSRFVFHHRAFDGKRVLVVGPANTLENELKSVDARSYDFVVVMNRAFASPLVRTVTKTAPSTVLFHNFVQDGARSAGPLIPSILKCYNVDCVVYPHGTLSEFRNFRRVRQHLHSICNAVDIRIIHEKFYSDLIYELDGAIPTTGFVALRFFMESNFAKLKIVGFTFFETAYTTNYNNTVGGDAAMHWATATSLHNPMNEKKSFIKHYVQLLEDGRPIELGHDLALMVRRELRRSAVREAAPLTP